MKVLISLIAFLLLVLTIGMEAQENQINSIDEGFKGLRQGLMMAHQSNLSTANKHFQTKKIETLPGIRRLVPQQYPTIQAAIDSSVHGDTVLVSDSAYFENIRFRGKAITIASYFLIDGDSSHIENTIINGSNPTHPDSGSTVYMINGEDTTSVLCGFTITGGTGTSTQLYSAGNIYRSGGGLFCKGAFGAKIIYNHIKNNRIIGERASGGGILFYNDDSYLIFENNHVTDNYVYTEVGFAIGGGAEIGGNNMFARIVANVFERDTLMGETFALGGGADITADPGLANGLVQKNIFKNNISQAKINNAAGGGFGCYSTNNLEIRENLFEGNIATSRDGWGEGGGILIDDEFLTQYGRKIVSGNSFKNNLSVSQLGNGSGGAIELFRTLATINNNYFYQNTAQGGNACGGAIGIRNSAFLLENNICNQNTSDYFGGAIYITNPPQIGNETEIVNNTIVNNIAVSTGGAIRVNNASLNIINSIVWSNSPNQFAIYNSLVNAVYNDIQNNWPGTGNINVNPLFVAGDSLYNLSDASHCIGAGIDSIDIAGTWYYAPSYDFDDDQRPNPSGSMPDMGAQESYLSFPIQGTIIHVPSDFSTIQAAINNSVDGDVVLVAGGSYQENISFKGKAITVASHFFVDSDTSHIANTIIDGSNPSHPDSGTVVNFGNGEDTTSVLCGFTVTGGTGTWFPEWNGRAGGGIGVYRSGAKIINNIVEYNTCRSTRTNTLAWGGGIDAFADTTDFDVIIENNIIRYDTVYTERSGYAGGLGVEVSGGRVRNNVIEHNACFSESRNSVGGGVLISKETSGYKLLDFSNNIIRDNLSRNYNGVYWSMGGGIMSWGSGTTFSKNIISNNRIRTLTGNWSMGAGLFINYPVEEVSIVNNKITNNYFTGGSCRGGGICIRSACPEISQNTISFNNASDGGGIYLDARTTSESQEGQIVHFRSARKSKLNNKANEKLSGNNFIIKNTLSGNTATRYGGGMALYYKDLFLIKNIIRNNSAGTASGGIELGNSSSKLINNTIVNNSGGTLGGGGILCINYSDPDIINTIIYGNTATGAGNQVNIYQNNCDPNFDYCNIAGGIAAFGGSGSGTNYNGTYQNCMNADPLMIDSVLAVGDTTFCCLSSGSPCIDAGHPSPSCNDLDGTRNDIGAHGGHVDSLYFHLTGLFKNPYRETIPYKYTLKQNYPNPFNANTTIEFLIPRTEYVTLSIYNLLGQEVTTLVSEKITPGEYKYTWDASQLASGVYIYKLETDNFSSTKKLILLK